MNRENIFSSLEEDFIDNEIKTDNELRNKKKTLQKKLKKKLNGPSESLLREIRILQTLISEYEDSQQTSPPQEKKKNKNKQKNEKSSSSESDDFLDREYNKHRETNQKRYKEQKEKEEREKEEKKRREEQRREQRREQKRREEYSDGEYSDEGDSISDILGQHQMKINDLPEDITPLINNYDHSLYRKLSVKYHPDKYPDDKYCKLLNCIKDFYQK
jgi:hypothetical protein